MGKNKKPKLTPEERKQLKIEKKLAKKLALEEKKRQIKRDYLTRELEYGKLSRSKLEKSWKNMLFSIKLPVLQIEFQLAVNNVEIILDSKDFQISFLMDELDDAEEQYNINLRSHVENMDKILEIYHLRLDDLKHKYDNEYNNLILDATNEKNLLIQKLETESGHLNTMIFRLDQEKKEMAKELRSEYLSKLNEETSKNIDEVGLMAQGRERTFENIWGLFKDTLRDYTKATEERKKEYDALYNHDVFMTNLISEQTVQLYNLQRKLSKLKDKQLCAREDLDKYVEFKQNERIFYYDAYKILRKQLDIDLAYDDEQLTGLVLASNDSLKTLESTAKQCEAVIKMYAVTQKLETQREKYLSFPNQLPLIHHKYGSVSNINMKFLEMKDMDAFWMKCAQGDASRHCLNEEREYLKKENAYLKRYLAKYCSGTKQPCSYLELKTNINQKG